MKRVGWVLVAVSVWGVSAGRAGAETISAESKITAVTVFPDRAGVTRQATLTLSKGQHTVALSPLPSGIEPSSLSARGAGEAEVTLYGVRLVTTERETAQDPKVEQLEDGIRDTLRKQQQLRNTKQVLAQEREYLESIHAASSQQIGKDLITKSPSASDAAALLAFLDESMLKTFERDQKADEELETLGRELDKLQRELSRLTEGRRRQETAVLVELEASKSGSFRLEVSYRVPGVAWEPAYEARASGGSDEVELATAGMVRQQTGEDWTDVLLTLSTARPALAGSMPELEPWFLRPWEPVAFERKARLMAASAPARSEMAMGQLQEGAPAEQPAREQEGRVAYATVEAAGPSVTFRLPRPASVPSDWQPHKVPVASARFPAELAYETTPRRLPYAFLRAKVTNTSEALYLPGTVSVFLDGTFVATSALKQVAPGESFDLYLGVDERVTVERKTLKERVEVSLLPGLRGKTKSTDYEFLTIIENFTGRRVSVTVFDQVPVSEREEIVVESVRQEPAAVEKDEEKPGVFHWQLDLAPNQKEELRLSYRVKHPVEMQIQ